MELRWHWTLDESNDERVSFTEYAKSVGRHRTTISEYAKGHQLILDDGWRQGENEED